MLIRPERVSLQRAGKTTTVGEFNELGHERENGDMSDGKKFLSLMGIKSSLLAVTALMLSSSVHAALIEYTLTDVVFDDFGGAIGSFYFDDVSNTYSQIDISTLAGSRFAWETNYTQADNVAFSPTYIDIIKEVADEAGTVFTIELFLFFATPLSEGGPVDLSSGSKEFIFNHDTGELRQRSVVTGTVAQVVPVPAAVWLFGSGLLGLTGVARRKVHF